MTSPDLPDVATVYKDSEVLSPRYRMRREPEEGADCILLYMQTFERATSDDGGWRSSPPEDWPLVATARPGRLQFIPLFSMPHAQRYLSPKHGPVRKLLYLNDALEMPAQDADVDAVLSFIDVRLPWKLLSPSEHGFGLEKELAEVWRMLGSLVLNPTLVVANRAKSHIDGDNIVISEADLDEMRRAMNRIDRRKRVGVQRDKQAAVFNGLITKLDPNRYRQIGAAQANPSTADSVLVRARRPNSVERRASRASVAAVRANLPLLASDAPATLMELHAEIERVTLARMIAVYGGLLSQDLPESRWQAFFEAHQFVLSLLFARPVALLHTQFRAQAASIDGSGAQIGDFLFRERGQGLAIVEIKKPGSTLLRSTPYRNTQVYAPSADLGGAVTQTLFQQSHLRSNWLQHRVEPTLAESMPDSIKCVVIAGMLPTDPARRRSFEIFRNACKDVDVVTFDELLDKLRLFMESLSPSTEAVS